jgi:valyl-tRNA synthetase
MTIQRDEVKAVSFDDLPKRFDIAERELHWRKRWDELGIHSHDHGAPRERNYVIDSPPPTASGSLHLGHMFSYTHQDLIARYRRMTGWNVVYPMGWDDNGLPTERRAQNFFGVRCDPDVSDRPELAAPSGIPAINAALDAIRPKKEREKDQVPISREDFIRLCHFVTEEDEKAYKELFYRLGLSIDWDEEYATIDDRCRRIAQRSFLDLDKKGHVYTAELPTMWDVDFQTAVAQAEVEDREKQGAYHDIEFAVFEALSPSPLEGEGWGEGMSDGRAIGPGAASGAPTEKKGGGVGETAQLPESFIISTTRPELLAACVGVTAHPDDPRFKGLFGKHAVTPVFFSKVPIFPSEKADPEKGTGILMVCTFGDQTDVEWWRENNLALKQVLDKSGRIRPMEYGKEWAATAGHEARARENFDQLAGLRVNQAKRRVVEMLQDPANSATGSGAPLQGEPKPITHPVRYYEKGDLPIEYLTSRQWFVRLLDKKDKLQEKGAQVQWRPEFMHKRYANWTDGLNADWAISRQRYFGVPIPVWYPLNAHGERQYDRYIVATEEMLPVDPTSTPPPGFTEAQRGQPNGFDAERDVFDTWFTSSLTPQLVARWGDPDDRMAQLFPMDLRPQAHDIIRTWAFYTIAKAMLHHDDIPWRNAAISGFIMDPDRKKMSKSKGNVVTPLPLVEEHGADSVRYWAANGRLGMDTAFDEGVFKIGGKLVTKLYNAGKFVLAQTGPVGGVTDELDRAFIAELRDVARRATLAMEQYEFANALQLIEEFFWSGFTDNYIELVKGRARSEDDAEGRASAIAGLRLGLSAMLRLFAPFVPTITDEVWSWAFADETGIPSVHMAPWPGSAAGQEPNATLSPGTREAGEGGSLPTSHDLTAVAAPANAKSFAAARDAIAAVRKAKSEAGISLGKPLSSLVLSTDEQGKADLSLVLADVAAAGGAPEVRFNGAATSADARYGAEITPIQD